MTIATLFLAALFASSQLISLDARDMDMSDFFRLIANVGNINVVLHPAVQGKVNLTVKDVPWEQALDIVLKSHNLAKEVEGNIIQIVPVAVLEAEQRQKAAIAQTCLSALPLRTQVYVLSYAKADTVAPIISKLLSPRGSVSAYPARNALIITDVEHPEQCSASNK